MIKVQSLSKPFAQSCEDNKAVILSELQKLLSNNRYLLEIGSGTGQHAVHFAANLPHLIWQPSELKENIAGLEMWLQEAELENVKTPAMLNVNQEPWPFEDKFDAAFTANTIHIMSIGHVEKLFNGLSKVLNEGGVFISYGPFNYNGTFTSESNARFDFWLKNRDPASGIRDIDELKEFSNAASIGLIDDIKMPENNRLLIWQKTPR